MPSKTKLKTFQISVQIDTFITAEVKAENMNEAFEKVKDMSTQELWDAPGAKEDESHKIIGIFES
jgi:hypothetical protein